MSVRSGVQAEGEVQGAEKEKRLPRKQEAGRVEGTSLGGG